MKTIIIPVLSLLCMSTPALTQNPDALDVPGVSLKGDAKLSLAEQKVESGARVRITCVFRNTGGGEQIYNPFLNSLLPPPVKIVLYDPNGVALGDLLPAMGSRRLPGKSDYVFVPSGGLVGFEHAFSARHPVTSELLPPGQYLVRVLFLGAYATFSKVAPEGLDPEYVQSFYNDFDRSELFRSDAVEFEVRPRAAN